MHGLRLRVVTFCLLVSAIPTGGCTELFIVFGPGGFFPPTSGSGTGSAATSQPAAIPGPSFTARQLDPVDESTAGARVVVLADMNNDGLDDFVSGSGESEPVQLHLRTSTAVEFGTVSIAGGAPISIMYDLGTADFDGDGLLDVAVLVNDTGFIPVTGADKRGAVVLLFAPAETGNPLAWQSVTITATFTLPNDETGMTDFAIADMDGVNGPDIVLGSNDVTSGTNTATKRIYLFRNPGGANARNAGLWAATTSPITADAPPFKSLETADIDGDGDLDVVATYPIAKSHNIRWIINPRMESGIAAVVAGNWTDRIVGEQRILSQPGDVQTPGADAIAVGDIDGDGDLDVASAFEAQDLVQWFENPGIGIVQVQDIPWRVFNIGQMTDTSVSINQIQLVDLNLDGTLDLFLTASGNMVGFQRGANVQSFWTPFSIVGTNPVATIGKCAFDDVDGNGLLDIIAPLDRDGVTKDQILILLRTTP